MPWEKRNPDLSNDPAYLEPRLNDLDAQLAETANKTEVRENTSVRPINVSEMDTETKQLFTGGAVAVVGVDAVGNENIKANAVSHNELSDDSILPRLFKQGTNANLFNKALIMSGEGYVNPDGEVIYPNPGFKYTDKVPLIANTTYTIVADWRDLGEPYKLHFYKADNSHISYVTGTTATGATFTTPFETAYCRITFPSTSDYNNTMLVFGSVPPSNYTAYGASFDFIKLSGSEIPFKTEGKNLLIFGDSRTETAAISDDGVTYTEGVRDNWPKFSKVSLGINQMWNYAKSGASFKEYEGIEPRQKIASQINTAIANNRPADIIVVDAGTNDGNNSLGTYDAAISKTTFESLDKTKTYEALRWAFWTLRQNYPNAICFACTPTQRADREPLTDLSNAIKQMANRYNFVVIDNEYESGIVKDYEVWMAEGRDLYDGLHPNTNGQIKMSKAINRAVLNYLNDAN